MLPPKAKNQDLRNYSVIPIQAAMDKRLHGTAALSLLVVICTYTDQLGVTWVSQDRLAVDLGVSRTAIAKQMRRLRDLGYIVRAKKRSRWQKTSSIKVVFPTAPEDEQEAKANLTAAQQIQVEEGRRQAGLQFEQEHNFSTKKPVDNSEDVQPLEVAGGATPGSCTNTPYNDICINTYIDESRQFCVMFLRSAESFGTPRNINDRDIEVMTSWIRNGLTSEKWAKILGDHWQYCRSQGRDYARGIGFFAIPVEKATGKPRRSNNQDAKSILQKAVRSTRG
jgi:DNA-binding Lrp family transcriptional regulator